MIPIGHAAASGAAVPSIPRGSVAHLGLLHLRARTGGDLSRMKIRQRDDGWWEIVCANRVMSAWPDAETARKITRLYAREAEVLSP